MEGHPEDTMTLTVHHDEYFDAPRDVVFDAATDIASFEKWMPNFISLEMLTTGEFRVGTQWRETRKFFGKSATEVFEVVVLEPGERFDLFVDGEKGSSGKGQYRFCHTFETEGDGTRMTIEGEVGGMSKVAELFGKVFLGAFKKAVVKDIQALRDYVASLQGSAITGDADISSHGTGNDGEDH